MRVLIAGCGYVGSALAARLAGAGDAVVALRRRPAALPPGVAGFAADLADPASLRALPGPFDAVVYAAAPDRRDEAAYRAVYVDGVSHAVEASAGARFVLVSSTSVYGQDDGSEVDESSPTEPREPTGRLVLDGEARARAAARSVVLRCGGLYGPGRTRLLDAARAGRLALAADAVRITNRIHRDDAAGALAHLLRLADPAPIYVGVDAEPASEETVYRWLAARVGRPLPDGPPGAGAVLPARGKRCSSRRLLESGYRLLFPTFREGYGALADARG